MRRPGLVSYSVYFSEDGRELTVVHVHVDAASLDDHMDVIGSRLMSFAELLTMSSIHIYGEPVLGHLNSCRTRFACSDLER